MLEMSIKMINLVYYFVLYLFLSMTIISCIDERNSPLKSPPITSIQIDQSDKTIMFSGKIYPKRYNERQDRSNGHHLIVWKEGRNAQKALINTEASDIEIQKALESIGALPGNNLTEATWSKRSDHHSDEPDKRVEGSKIKIYIHFGDTKYKVEDLLIDTDSADFDIRFGGHIELVPVWKSGCVTCLFSCPGGRTSNAVYTIRDQYLNRKTFEADLQALPADGSDVTIEMEVSPDEPTQD